jgi:hypothetical protein
LIDTTIPLRWRGRIIRLTSRCVAGLTAMEFGGAMSVLLVAGALLSCAKQPTAVQVYQSLLSQPVPASAGIVDWKIVRGIAELHAFFAIEMSKEDFERGFSRNGFSRNRDEENTEILAIYGRDISEQMKHQVKVPSPAIHLVRKSPGKIIHVFWQESSGSLLVWIKPGPMQ